MNRDGQVYTLAYGKNGMIGPCKIETELIILSTTIIIV